MLIYHYISLEYLVRLFSKEVDGWRNIGKDKYDVCLAQMLVQVWRTGAQDPRLPLPVMLPSSCGDQGGGQAGRKGSLVILRVFGPKMSLHF